MPNDKASPPTAEQLYSSYDDAFGLREHNRHASNALTDLLLALTEAPKAIAKLKALLGHDEAADLLIREMQTGADLYNGALVELTDRCLELYREPEGVDAMSAAKAEMEAA